MSETVNETAPVRTADPVRGEMLAIQRVGKAIAGLPTAAQRRVLGYAFDVLNERSELERRAQEALRASEPRTGFGVGPLSMFVDNAKAARSNGL